MMKDRTLADDLKIQISNYKAQRANLDAEMGKIAVKMSEFTMRIMELENLLDKHASKVEAA